MIYKNGGVRSWKFDHNFDILMEVLPKIKKMVLTIKPCISKKSDIERYKSHLVQ